ncbi:hypothetical protein FXN65_17480 [Metapseudomonas lalkuanensis]|uniref:Uncharacterized protein n=1 Tax=Metapseudomonas lalkuanensis TaxID=2604832 RepID=A0A5J6QNA0_9GAMM|nr:hypothetical protein [Pseudomonas lalkuanensis]QEY63757.1 hypothetical protein FXN65_17480 [Pseudomonas lalkuanensis]UCO96374.1 hypothetical protein LF844_17005 [Pseudomonas lalkuanensis]
MAADNWKAFDLAEWCLDLMISHYAQLIHVERQQSEPDQMLIEKWQHEHTHLDERDALRIEDRANSERVSRIYAPLLRTLSRQAGYALEQDRTHPRQ